MRSPVEVPQNLPNLFENLREVLFPGGITEEQRATLRKAVIGGPVEQKIQGMHAALKACGKPIFANAFKIFCQEESLTLGPYTEASILNMQLVSMMSQDINLADPIIKSQLDHDLLFVAMMLVQGVKNGEDDRNLGNALSHEWKNRFDELRGKRLS